MVVPVVILHYPELALGDQSFHLFGQCFVSIQFTTDSLKN
jgi:hypothetical protein